MAFNTPLDRNRSSMQQPLPVGPDVAPMAVAAPPNLTGGAGAPSLGAPAAPAALTQNTLHSLSQLGTALGQRIGAMGRPAIGHDVRGRQMGDFPAKRPVAYGAPLTAANVVANRGSSHR